MVLLYQAGNANTGAVNYSMEVSCLAGVCTPVYPPCTLKNAASYASGTLTMNFTVGNNVATTWNAWLTDQKYHHEPVLFVAANHGSAGDH